MHLEEHGLNALSRVQELELEKSPEVIQDEKSTKIIGFKAEIEIEIIWKLRPDAEIKKREEGRLERVKEMERNGEVKSARGRMKYRQSLHPWAIKILSTLAIHHATQ